MLDDIATQIKRIDAVQTRTKVWRDRIEDDYSQFRGDLFQIPTKEGEWESYTTNSAAVLGDSVVNAVSEARLKLWIPVGAEDKRDRKTLSATEQLSNGAIWMANILIESVPEGIDIQSELSFHAGKRGATALRCFLREEEGKLIPDIAVWDPLNLYWHSGRGRFLWVAYLRYGSKVQLEDEYEGKFTNIEEDAEGRIKLWNVWDTDEEGVFVGDEWIEKEEHGLDHIPVFIRPTGSTPIVQSTRYTDTIKDWGESVISKNRNLYPAESRLLSYEMTRAGISAKTPKVIMFDSRLSPLPPEFDKDPEVKGRVILLDAAKGQSMAEFIQQSSNQDIIQMKAFVSDQISRGGMSPPDFGRGKTATEISFQGAEQRRTFNPSKKNVERCFVWLAEEIIRQYKHGDFKENEIEGYDSKGKKFHVKVDPDKIDDNWRFEAELKLNLLRDEIGMMELAVQSTDRKILSYQTARDKYTDVQDTDQEQEIINREEAEEITNVKLWDLLTSLIEDRKKSKTPLSDLTIMGVMNKIMIESGVQPVTQGNPEIAAQQNEPVTTANMQNRLGLEFAGR